MPTSDSDDRYPLTQAKAYDQTSVFQAENLLREARRQRGLPDVPVPAVCLLDPDGDIADYHTTMYMTELEHPGAGPLQVGVVSRAVGAPFAVLVAEQLQRALPATQRESRTAGAAAAAPDLLRRPWPEPLIPGISWTTGAPYGRRPSPSIPPGGPAPS
jgi:hypothetical protein